LVFQHLHSQYDPENNAENYDDNNKMKGNEFNSNIHEEKKGTEFDNIMDPSHENRTDVLEEEK
jgi:hypothetical protein